MKGLIVMDVREAGEKLKGLAVFRCLTKDEAVKSFIALCCEPCPERGGEFAELLYRKTACWTEYLLEKVLLSENTMSVKKAYDEKIDTVIQKRADRELELLERVSRLTPKEFGLDELWETEERDFKSAFYERLENVKKTGFGDFAEHNMFTVKGDRIVPAVFKDEIDISSIKGYERQKTAVENNIKALVKGKTAADMLLYGDSGTGKSATVKALCNLYASEGVRLIEIKKSQIDEIPDIMGRVSRSPLKFILFLDDLTFDPSDGSFNSMKAVLEGSVAARAVNTCICVTSNRRHLVKESVSDRMAGDLHARDTMEEIGALTQRFGLSVIYEKPDKEAYFKVIRELGADMGLKDIDDALLKEAEAFAISKGGRSCRTAKHFIEEVLRRA